MINLIDGGIQHSNLFIHMPLFDEIYYEGYLEGMVRKYRALREGQGCRILSLNVIRKDEDVIWDALDDMLKGSVSQAALKTQGIYAFDLLTVDIHNEIKTFNLNELSNVIVNNALRLAPGQKRLVKYSSVYGLLQKLVVENWGKITFKSSVEVFKDKPDFFDLLIKQLLKNFDPSIALRVNPERSRRIEFAHDPGILVLNDLSQNPLFDSQNSLQQTRLKKVIDEQIPKSIEFVPEVYVQDKNGVRELLSGSVLK